MTGKINLKAIATNEKRRNFSNIGCSVSIPIPKDIPPKITINHGIPTKKIATQNRFFKRLIRLTSFHLLISPAPRLEMNHLLVFRRDVLRRLPCLDCFGVNQPAFDGFEQKGVIGNGLDVWRWCVLRVQQFRGFVALW